MEKHLKFLNNLSNEQLKPIIDLMKDTWTDELSEEAKNNPIKHLDEITNELGKYAGNTIANIFRGGIGISYRETLTDVCKKQKVQFTKYTSTEKLGTLLIEQTFANTIDKMSKKEKEEFIEVLKEDMAEEEFSDLVKEASKQGGLYALSGTALATILVKSAGFGLYKVSAIVVFGIFHALGYSVPHWLAWGGLATIIKTGTKILCGPLLWIIFGTWQIIDIASPATRITIPVVLYIECMRIISKDKKHIN